MGAYWSDAHVEPATREDESEVVLRSGDVAGDAADAHEMREIVAGTEDWKRDARPTLPAPVLRQLAERFREGSRGLSAEPIEPREFPARSPSDAFHPFLQRYLASRRRSIDSEAVGK